MYGEEARGEDDADDDDDEGQEAEVEATLRANVPLAVSPLCIIFHAPLLVTVFSSTKYVAAITLVIPVCMCAFRPQLHAK